MRKALTATLLASLAGQANAGDIASLSPGDFFADFPVVLSASRLLQPAEEAPAAMTVIDRTMIRASGARRIAELFRLIPGFLVGYRSGHEATVTYHGLADGYARRLQVMVDGISVYSPIYGGVDWNDLPIAIEDIERIEVVRGPNGASFGANAVVGMVNIITREAIGGRETSVSSNAGANGIADVHVQHLNASENLRYRASAGVRRDKGFANFDDTSEVRYFNLHGHYRLDKADELSAGFGHSAGYGQIELTQIRPRRNEQYDAQLRWTRAIDANNEFWLQLHHFQRHTTEDFSFVLNVDPIATIPAMQIPTRVIFKYETRRDEVEFQQSLAGGDTTRYVWGGHWRQDAVRSQTWFNRDDWIYTGLARVFGSAEWRPLPQLLLQGGATFEHPGLGATSLSPRVSATAFIADGHTLRLGVSQARRNPLAFEEMANQTFAVPTQLRNAILAIPPSVVSLIPLPYRNTIFSPVYVQTYLAGGGLHSEKILSRELAYLGKLPSLRLNGELRWFRDGVRDLIYVHQIPFPTVSAAFNQASDFRNADSATVRGVEGSLRWSPWQGATLQVAAARTIIHSTNIDANYSATAPNSNASALFLQELPAGVSVSTGYYRVGAMRWLSNGSPMPEYERFDIRLAKRFQLGPNRGELAWVTQNVLGSNYPDFYAKLVSKRAYWLQARLEF